MVYHVVGAVGESARDRRRNRTHLRTTTKLNPCSDLDHLHTVQPGEEIVMPKGATILAIRDRLQADLFLHTDDLADGAVFNLT
jgi:hypothetical protein